MLKRRRTEQDELLVRPTAPRAVRHQPPPSVPPPSREPDPEEVSGPELPDRPERPRKRRRRRSVLLLVRPIAVLVGLLVAAYLCFPLVFRLERLRPIVENSLGQTVGRKVRVGSLKLTFTLGALIASDVTVTEDPAFGHASFAHAKEVVLDVHRLPLLFGGRVEIDSIDINDPTVTLRRDSAGHWNFAGALRDGAAPSPGGVRVRVRNGIVTIRRDESGDPVTLRAVNADFPRVAGGVEMTFAISGAVDGGGTMKLNGKAGPVFWEGGSPRMPLNMLVNAKQVALSGSNLTDKFAPALDGTVSFDGSVESDGNALTASGNARLAGLKLAQLGTAAADPLLIVLTVRHDLNTGSGEFSRCEIHLGKGSAEVKGSYQEAGGRPTVRLAMEARGIPVKPLASLVNAAGIPLPSGTSLQGGVAFLQLAIQGPVDRPTTTGKFTIENATLVAFDAAERFSAIGGLDALRTGRDLGLDSLTADVNAGPERVALENIEADLAEIGKITGSGAILDNRTLDFRLQAVRTGVNDRRPIPFVVRGACSAPIFRQPGKL